MKFGPVELLVIRFPGNQFKGEIIPALEELVKKGTIRIIDVLFVKKDAKGNAEMIEMNDLEDEIYAAFDPIVSDIQGMLTEEDVVYLTGNLEKNSSAAVMLFENVWATRFRDAIVNAKGEIILSERIPRQVIEEIQAAQEKQPVRSQPAREKK
jgi:translation initiation factor IF-2